MSEAKSGMTKGAATWKGGVYVVSEFCSKCGCQKDEDHMNYKYCEDCLEEWVEENEVYL